MSGKMFSTDYIDQSKCTPKYRVYKSRWALLTAMFFINFFFGTVSDSYDSYNTPTSEDFTPRPYQRYRIYFSIIFPVSFLVCSTPATLIIKKVGILPSLYCSGILSFAGLILRYVGLCFDNFEKRGALLLLGHTIHGLGNTFSITCTSSVSQFWFPMGQRTMATSISFLGLTIGQLVSIALSFYVVKDGDTTGLMNMTYVHGIFILLALVPLFFVWRSKPKSPPSASADELIFDYSLKQTKICNLWVINNCCIIGVTIGSIVYYSDIQKELLFKGDFTPTFKSLNIIILIFVTGIGCLCISGIVDSTYGHKTVFRTCLALFTICSCLHCWVDLNASKHLVTIGLFCLMAIFSVGLISAGIELTVETLFDKHPAIGSGIVLSVSNFAQFVYIVISAIVSDSGGNGMSLEPQTMEMILSAVLLLTFLLSLIFLRWIPQRRLYEDKLTGFNIRNVLTSNALGLDERRTRF